MLDTLHMAKHTWCLLEASANSKLGFDGFLIVEGRENQANSVGKNSGWELDRQLRWLVLLKQ
jgi:hypothetical protein